MGHGMQPNWSKLHGMHLLFAFYRRPVQNPILRIPPSRPMPRRYSPIPRSPRSPSSSSSSSLSSPTYFHRRRASSRRLSRRSLYSESSYDSDFDKQWSRHDPRPTHSRRLYPSINGRSHRHSNLHSSEGREFYSERRASSRHRVDHESDERYLNSRSRADPKSGVYYRDRRRRSPSPIVQRYKGHTVQENAERYRQQGIRRADGIEDRTRTRDSARDRRDNPRLGSLERHGRKTEHDDLRRDTEARTHLLDRQGDGNGGWRASTTAREWINDTPEEGETRWQKRRKIRESLMGRVNVWDVSPEPPRKLAERFDVGADERKKKERKRKRKEERRARREAKRARMVAGQNKSSVGVGTGEGARGNEQENGSKSTSRPVDDEEEEEEEAIGPAPPKVEREGVSKGVDYGKALRPGEGSKMAAFVQDGARIPRRGEIGLTSEEISAFETQGYVMSGSRNRRMEAIRLRKENQIYSAEELAALSQFSHEERKLREERIMHQFRALVESKVGETERLGETEDTQGSDAKPKQRSQRVGE